MPRTREAGLQLGDKEASCWKSAVAYQCAAREDNKEGVIILWRDA